ncbi:MAG TPA: hypothetical protein VM818_05840 [Vicinamibacterales bacterium]|jgi:hypothetical protein|nr:hypothetical protein [Vicinamibacterales bacterium]
MRPFQETAGTAIPDLGPLQQRLFLAGSGGALVSLVGFFVDRAQFFQSYLLAYMWCLGLTLGCLALGMVHQLSGGAWGVVIRRPIGAAARVLPVMTALFLPVALGMGSLYEWTHADVVAKDELLQHKQLYLNTPFFLVRAGVYFLTWNLVSHWLNRWGREQDRTADPRLARKMQLLSGGGLVAYGLTITFASFDWLMSLEPHWFSTMYGILIIGGQGLSALAFLILTTVWLSRRPPLDRIVVASHLHDLGNLMLAFVMLWAYFSFSQYLIIWAGNLPHEITWYLHRVQTSWRYVGVALIVFHFALPFVLLLSRAVKRRAEGLANVAVVILTLRVVDLWWLIAPNFHRDGIEGSWMDLVLPLSMGSIWLACFIRQLRARPILPIHDPQFDEALGDIIERGGEEPRPAH